MFLFVSFYIGLYGGDWGSQLMRNRGVQHRGEVFLLHGFVVQQSLRDFYELYDLALLVVEIYVELLDHEELRGLLV